MIHSGVKGAWRQWVNRQRWRPEVKLEDSHTKAELETEKSKANQSNWAGPPGAEGLNWMKLTEEGRVGGWEGPAVQR